MGIDIVECIFWINNISNEFMIYLVTVVMELLFLNVFMGKDDVVGNASS